MTNYKKRFLNTDIDVEPLFTSESNLDENPKHTGPWMFNTEYVVDPVSNKVGLKNLETGNYRELEPQNFLMVTDLEGDFLFEDGQSLINYDKEHYVEFDSGSYITDIDVLDLFDDVYDKCETQMHILKEGSKDACVEEYIDMVYNYSSYYTSNAYDPANSNFIATFIVNYSLERIANVDITWKNIIQMSEQMDSIFCDKSLNDENILLSLLSLDRVLEIIIDLLHNKISLRQDYDFCSKFFTITTSSLVKYQQLYKGILMAGLIPVRLNFEVPEIQGHALDILWKKSMSVKSLHYSKILVEDTCLLLEALNWKCGPYIKELMSMGVHKLYALCKNSRTIWMSNIMVKWASSIFLCISVGVEGSLVSPSQEGYSFDRINSFDGIHSVGQRGFDDVTRNPRLIASFLLTRFLKHDLRLDKLKYIIKQEFYYRLYQRKIYCVSLFKGSNDLKDVFIKYVKEWGESTELKFG